MQLPEWLEYGDTAARIIGVPVLVYVLAQLNNIKTELATLRQDFTDALITKPRRKHAEKAEGD